MIVVMSFRLESVELESGGRWRPLSTCFPVGRREDVKLITRYPDVVKP